MIKKIALFGLATDDFERAATRINRILDIKMSGCEGHAWGAPYYFHEFEDGMEIALFQNWNAFDGEWNYDDYSDFDLIVRVQEADDLTQIHKKLTGDPLLRAELLKERSY